MSTHAAQLINAVPDIESKMYLELGVAAGGTFKRVRARRKFGVDINATDGHAQVMRIDTDHFFAAMYAFIYGVDMGQGLKIPGIADMARGIEHNHVFDIVFIDADHRYESVLRDYNNAVRWLKPNGYIFIHDLVPPDEAHCAPEWCGDGWRFLLELWGCGAPTRTLNTDYGLTCVRDWRMYPDRVPHFEPHPQLGNYREFSWMREANLVVGLDEMLRWIKEGP